MTYKTLHANINSRPFHHAAHWIIPAVPPHSITRSRSIIAEQFTLFSCVPSYPMFIFLFKHLYEIDRFL